MAHDLTRDELSRCLATWAYFVACAAPMSVTLPMSLVWLRLCWEAGHDHLPLVLVHDLGQLLLQGRDFRFASARDLARWPESECATRLAYEDRVVGRWALDPSVTEAHVMIAGMPSSLRDAAVAHACSLALSRRLRMTEEVVLGNPAHLRMLMEATLKAVPEEFEGWQEVVETEWVVWVAEQIARVASVLTTTRLFQPEDLWEIEHLAQLPSESTRLALRELNGLGSRIGVVPASVVLTIRQKAREILIEAEEADQYPAGGFDAIATRGTFENLVRSEVAYVGEGSSQTGGVDLFDVRFAESELLYYTRDESPLLDARRDLTVVLDRPSRQRHKHPSLASQTLVLTQTLALTLQRDLLRVFGPAGSRVRLVWRCETHDDQTVADEEMSIVALILAAEIAHRRVELLRVDTWTHVPDAGRVVVSPYASEADLFWIAWLRVDTPQWHCLDQLWDVALGEPTLRSLADALLVAIARRKPQKSRRQRVRVR
jgi:hypothetical protein